MTQTKKISLIESIANTLIGFVVSLMIQLFVYNSMDIPVTIQQNIVITFIFTIASIVRGYVVRRVFNKMLNTKL